MPGDGDLSWSVGSGCCLEGGWVGVVEQHEGMAEYRPWGGEREYLQRDVPGGGERGEVVELGGPDVGRAGWPAQRCLVDDGVEPEALVVEECLPVVGDGEEPVQLG